MNPMYSGGDGSRTGTPREIRALRHDAGLRHAKEHRAAVPRCEIRSDVACTAVLARGHAQRRGWLVPGVRIGNMGCVLPKPNLRRSTFASCFESARSGTARLRGHASSASVRGPPVCDQSPHAGRCCVLASVPERAELVHVGHAKVVEATGS